MNSQAPCTALVPLTAEQKAYGSLIVRQTKAARKADLGSTFEQSQKEYQKAQLAVEAVAAKVNAAGGKLRLLTDEDGTQYLVANKATQKAREAHLLANRKVAASFGAKSYKAANIYALYAALIQDGHKLPKLATFPNGEPRMDGLAVATRLQAKGFSVELR